MATIDCTGTGPTAGATPYMGVGKVYVAKGIMDATAGAMTTGDVYQVIGIPADTLVMHVSVEVLTAATGTTCTLDVGDGSGANSWDNDINGKATAGTITHSIVGTDAYAVAASQGKFYDAADSIDVVVDTATDITAGCKLAVYALCVSFN